MIYLMAALGASGRLSRKDSGGLRLKSDYEDMFSYQIMYR